MERSGLGDLAEALLEVGAPLMVGDAAGAAAARWGERAFVVDDGGRAWSFAATCGWARGGGGGAAGAGRRAGRPRGADGRATPRSSSPPGSAARSPVRPWCRSRRCRRRRGGLAAHARWRASTRTSRDRRRARADPALAGRARRRRAAEVVLRRSRPPIGGLRRRRGRHDPVHLGHHRRGQGGGVLARVAGHAHAQRRAHRRPRRATTSSSARCR